MRGNLAAGTILASAGLSAPVQAPVTGFGVQAALGLSHSGDRHVTAGKALSLAIGIHQDCPKGEHLLIS